MKELKFFQKSLLSFIELGLHFDLYESESCDTFAAKVLLIGKK